MQVMKYTTHVSSLEGVCVASAASQLHAPTLPQGAVKSTRIPPWEGAPWAHSSCEHSPPLQLCLGPVPARAAFTPRGPGASAHRGWPAWEGPEPWKLQDAGLRALTPLPPSTHLGPDPEQKLCP